MKRIAKGCAAALLALAAGLASAFPDKPIRLVLPYPAGGPTDAVARTVADKLSAAWGQPVIVDNRPGASGNIGTEFVAKSPADGYTLLIHSPIMLATELTRPSVRYRTLKDFKPVSLLFSSAVFMMASNQAMEGGLKQVLASAVGHPGGRG